MKGTQGLARPMRHPAAMLLVAALMGPSLALPGAAFQHGGSDLPLPAPTVVRALAVAETSTGFVGSLSTVSITAAPGGTGHVFVDTSPLAQVDMQGSARLAVRVAAAVTGLPLQDHDYFFVVRSPAPVIGGPSAGGILTVGTIAALKGWAVNQSVMMTGTITPSGDIGPIGGLLEKVEAAARGGATLFLFPEGQENVTRLTSGVFRGAPVHVPSHCATLGIRCIPVSTVEDAVRHVTGHAFDRPSLGGNVTSEDFLVTMRPLAQNLTQQARQLVQETSAHFDRAARSIPAQTREALQRSLAEASRAQLQAQTAYDEGRYYTASSRSYQASLAARSVDYSTGLFEAPNRDAYVRALLDDAEARAAGAVANATLDARGVSLEALGAAQERATEAERAAASARAQYQSGDAGAALGFAAQARERSESVRWWLDIARRAPGGLRDLDREVLNRTARDLVDTAREAIVYAQVILQEEGLPAPELLGGAGGAADLLDRAEADLARGFLPAAVFEAVGAEVRAAAALEVAGAGAQALDAKLQRARERAAAAIVEARAGGLEPILAQSYFELAGDLPEPEDALAFYNTARSVALLGKGFFAPDAEPRASRFVGFLPTLAPAPLGAFASAGGALVLAGALVLGLLLGGGVGILATHALRPAPPRSSWLPPRPPPAPPADEPAKVDPFLEYSEGAPPPPPRLGEDLAPPRR